MANFDAKVQVDVVTGGAERALRKIERNVSRIEDKSRDILSVDKQLLQQRKQLIGLTGDQAKKAQNNVKLLTLQRRELQLQKTELTQINRLEKQRASSITRGVSGGSSPAGGGGGSTGNAGLVAAAAGAVAFSPKQLVQKSKSLQALQEFRDRQNDGLDATIEDLEEKTRIYQQKLDRFNEVRAKRPLLTSKGTFQPTTRTSRNAFNTARDNMLQSRRDVAFGQAFTGKIDDQIAAAADEIDKATKAAQRGNNVMGGFAKSLLLAAGAYISVEAAARQAVVSIQKSIATASSEQRIRALADGFDDYEAVLLRASNAADKFNISQIEANNQFAQLYGRLRPLGLTLGEINTVFEGFNTAAALTGATAAESAGALLQLSQALGAGALRGEEFNSIAEQAPAVLQAIGKELNVPIGQLKALAKEGKITSDVVVAALSRVRTEGADKLANALDTPAQKVQKLSNRFEELQVALGDLALPATIALIDQLTGAVERSTGKVKLYTEALNKLLEPLGGLKIDVPLLADAFSKLPVEIAKSIPGLGQIIQALQRIDFLAQQITKEAPSPRNFGANYKEQERALFEAAGGYNPYAPTTPLSDRLGLTGLDGGGGGGGGGRSAADILADQLKTGEELSREFSRQVQLLQAAEGLERDLLQIEFDREDRMRSIADAAAEQRAELIALSDELEGAQMGTAIGEALGQDLLDNADSLATAMDQAQSEFNDFFSNLPEDPFEQLFAQTGQKVADALTNTIGTAIEGLITGADDLNEKLQAIASNLLRDLGSMFLRAGINAAAGPGGLFGPSGLPGFANGGTIPMGTTAVVGEQGPEILTLRPNGADVYPNDAFADAAASMSTPSASTAFAESAEAMEMATATRASNIAIQQEQTAMAAAAAQSSSSSILVETTLVDEIEVVSLEQLNRATKASAKQAEANVMKGLRNMPATRSRAGVR